MWGQREAGQCLVPLLLLQSSGSGMAVRGFLNRCKGAEVAQDLAPSLWAGPGAGS